MANGYFNYRAITLTVNLRFASNGRPMIADAHPTVEVIFPYQEVMHLV